MKKHSLAFIDLETTGLDPARHEIIEIGAIIARPLSRAGRGPELEVLEEFGWKIKPTRLQTAEPEALRINGYNAADWLFALDLVPALKSLAEKTAGAIMVGQNVSAEKTAGAIMVGQNVSFDWSFLQAAFNETKIEPRFHYHRIDLISLAFAKLYHDERAQRFNLSSLAEHFGLKQAEPHTALGDIRLTLEIYKKLLAI